jgi:hypothetical protein
MPNVTINVTQEDIDQGHMIDPKCCPIALAIKRTINTDFITVGGSGSVWVKRCSCDQNCPHKAKLPRKALNFLHNFDSMGQSAVKPLAFRLAIPDNT